MSVKLSYACEQKAGDKKLLGLKEGVSNMFFFFAHVFVDLV